MKTVFSLPDPLFEAAGALAARLGVSRSQLFTSAIAEFLAKHLDQAITERLDAVYGGEEKSLDQAVRHAQAQSTPNGQW